MSRNAGNNRSNRNKFIYTVITFVVLAIIYYVVNSLAPNSDENSSSVTPTVTQAAQATEEAEDTDAPTEDPEEAEATSTPTEAPENTYTFRTQTQLEEHFEKHGDEFDYATAEEYEAGANAVINNPSALSKTEAEDGDYVYYVEETNEFVILSTDGYIRTYFKPSAGIDYYNRQ